MTETLRRTMKCTKHRILHVKCWIGTKNTTALGLLFWFYFEWVQTQAYIGRYHSNQFRWVYSALVCKFDPISNSEARETQWLTTNVVICVPLLDGYGATKWYNMLNEHMNEGSCCKSASVCVSVVKKRWDEVWTTLRVVVMLHQRQ